VSRIDWPFQIVRRFLMGGLPNLDEFYEYMDLKREW